MTDPVTITVRVEATDAVWASIARAYFAALIELRRAIDQGDDPAAARAARNLTHFSDSGAHLATIEKGARR
ncbi:hypothetical protein [Zavarzinia sp.]|uniref:hypothetical protein n=1 Tax=Zavarzinia sp. TaxID=2027920 RepID=UPI003BB77B53